MLFRFREQQAADLGIIDAGRTRRPKVITEVTAIPACEKWRGQVVKDISRKVTKIQDPSLSDYQIRDLNDEINKLMREKHMWEVQLRNLGGPNYMRFGPKTYDEDGREVPGSRGYKYFGRARELPGVKELFDELKPSKKAAEGKDEERRLRAEMRRNVDADYYGFNRDEDDGVLLAYERAKEVESFRNVERTGEEGVPEGWTPIPDGWVVPGLEEVTEFLVERRKSRLLQRLG
ncbi:Isy1-like splicing factor [Tuber magnatum]|uniref:Isy1-like splicing factor n=1 Tax=Tuber magnatum TaxID=42249 RepID=A0A317SKH5_9PEZI|nr:Isy1-like splicing factor [Tuber magnatum]